MILFIWFIIIILFSLKFYGLGDQVLHLFTSWPALITYVLRQHGQHEEKSSLNIIIKENLQKLKH